MKVMVISTVSKNSYSLYFVVLIVLLLQLASAIEFSFDSSSNGDGEFDVSLNSGTNEKYDVKIYAFNGDKSDKESEIFSENENKWKSSYYYLKSVFPDESNFKIRAKNISKEWQICVRLRKSGGSSFKEKCNDINSESNSKSAVENSVSDAGIVGRVVRSNMISENLTDANTVNSAVKSKNETNDGIIVLNSLAMAAGNGKTFVSNDEKLRRFMIYVFIGFCIIMAIFIALRSLRIFKNGVV